ncbi:iron-only hydrogenase system regulator [Lachnospiraceae bacterium OttesenSCG-928-D06]|nr:iron-only hydrogenase system regulator [Lachnospiraceae bacterium OttesenSCG-928-D06]
MEKRVALIGVIVENTESVEKLNSLLHEYGEYIIGRMGVPYREKKMNIISITIDAPEGKISALSGKIGMLDGVVSKVIYGKKESCKAPESTVGTTL